MKNIFERLKEKNIPYAVCSSLSMLAGSDRELGKDYYILMYYRDGNQFKTSTTDVVRSKYGVEVQKKTDGRIETVFNKPAMFEYNMTGREAKIFLNELRGDKYKEVLNTKEGDVWELKDNSFKTYINSVDYTIKSSYNSTLFQ